MAVVFQDPFLLRRSVADNVALGLKLRGAPGPVQRERAAYWMQRFGIAHLAQRSALTLSGGEAQRANLARAFALDPEVLFLDEPFASLDEPTRMALLDDLSSVLRETAVTGVFVTHDRSEALRLGDRVAVMMDGVIRQVGTPPEVFAAPVDEEVAAFVGIETIVPGCVRSCQDGLALVEVAGQLVEAAVAREMGPEVLVCLRPEDVVLSPVQDHPGPTSARNHLPAVVRRILPAGPHARVHLDAGFGIAAIITKQSLEELALAPGTPVVASFKATAVHLIKRRSSL